MPEMYSLHQKPLVVRVVCKTRCHAASVCESRRVIGHVTVSHDDCKTLALIYIRQRISRRASSKIRPGCDEHIPGASVVACYGCRLLCKVGACQILHAEESKISVKLRSIACYARRRQLQEQDVLTKLRNMAKHSEKEINNRPLIGVLSQVSRSCTVAR